MPKIPLKELEPSWSVDGCLIFECPSCGPEASCFLGVPTQVPLREGGPVWGWNGKRDFDKVTLNPSINYDLPGSTCKFHGWVREGVVEW